MADYIRFKQIVEISYYNVHYVFLPLIYKKESRRLSRCHLVRFMIRWFQLWLQDVETSRGISRRCLEDWSPEDSGAWEF